MKNNLIKFMYQLLPSYKGKNGIKNFKKGKGFKILMIKADFVNERFKDKL